MLKKRVLWFLVNAGFIAALWFGFEEGVKGAKHLVYFFVWFCFVLSLFTISKEVADSLRSEGNSVPLWLAATVDAVAVAFMVWQGAWVIGAAYLTHTILTQAVFKAPNDRAPT